MGKEMNFFDLCVACGRAIGRGCLACWRLFERMLRLTYHYWWIVLMLVILSIAAALYYTRSSNLTYKMNAVALLNGPTIQQFDQAFVQLQTMKMLPDDAAVKALLHDRKVGGLETFRVIDCMHDGGADFIDFKRSSSATDTLKVQMQDRLCLQFRVKARDLDLLPEIESALLDYLNANDAMQQSYAKYLENLREEAAFNHRQALKLDSLTSHYYFRGHLGSDSFEKMQQGTVIMSDLGGNWNVKLFLKDIYAQQKHMQCVDYRLQLATAPVTLENHFAADPNPVNGRLKILVIFFLLGWIGGCVIAEIIDKRKAICAWLKQ